MEICLDNDTFEALSSLEARVDALRAVFIGLVTALTSRNRGLERPIHAHVQGAFVEASETQAHESLLNELREIGEELRGLYERRDDAARERGE